MDFETFYLSKFGQVKTSIYEMLKQKYENDEEYRSKILDMPSRLQETQVTYSFNKDELYEETEPTKEEEWISIDEIF